MIQSRSKSTMPARDAQTRFCASGGVPASSETDRAGETRLGAEIAPTARGVRCWSFTVPFDVGRASKNRLRKLSHWSQQSPIIASARTQARKAWLDAGSPKATGKVRASLVVRRLRSMDEANALSGAAGILDGIFVNGLTPDDSPRYLEIGSVTFECGAAWKGREEVVVLVEEVGDTHPADAGRAARLEAVLAAAQRLDTYPVDLRGWNQLRAAVKNVEVA